MSDEELATQTRFWESMTMSKGDFSPATLTMRPSLIRPAGKEQQLIVRAIGNPDIAVCGDPDAHQAEEFLLEGEIAFRADRLAVEIHDENLAVEAGRSRRGLSSRRCPSRRRQCPCR